VQEEGAREKIWTEEAGNKWRGKVCNEKLHSLHNSQGIIKLIKSGGSDGWDI
jgi:hypothetical protein